MGFFVLIKICSLAEKSRINYIVNRYIIVNSTKNICNFLIQQVTTGEEQITSPNVAKLCRSMFSNMMYYYFIFQLLFP